MKKILFIGGTKFIGSMLVNKFLDEKISVYIFSHSAPISNNAHYIPGDRNNNDDLRQLKESIKGQVFDLVYDMCCYTPLQARQMAEMLIPHTKHLIFFSSAAVYAKTEYFPLNEKSKIGAHPSFGDYGTNKAAAEVIYDEACKKHDVGLTIFRPHYILGPGDYFMRHQYFYSRLEKGIPIDLPGNGESLIQFAFASDVALLFYDIPNKQTVQTDVINIASPEIMSLVGTVNLFAKSAKQKPLIRHINYEDYDLNEQFFYDDYFPFPNLNLVLDVTHAEQDYGFQGLRLVDYIDDLFNEWTLNKQNYQILPTPFQ